MRMPIINENMDMTEQRTERLPVIVGKPYKPKPIRNPCTGTLSLVHCKDSECKDGPDAHTQKVMNGTMNGTGYLERKASGEIVYAMPSWCKVNKPFKMPPELKARNETPTKAFKRMKKDCTAVMTKDEDAGRYKSQVGRTVAEGYKIVATNGHWMLCERETVKSKKPVMPWMGDTGSHKRFVLDDPEFQLAVWRAEIMADKGKKVKIWSDGDNVVHLYSGRTEGKRGEAYGTFEADLTIACGITFRMTLNHDYLDIPLGCWPLTVYVRVRREDESTEDPVIFEPSDKSWRFVVMPMRG